MKKVFICLLCLGISVPAFAGLMKITSQKVNIRSSANTSAPVLKTLKTGAVIETIDGSEIIDGKNVWIKVKLGDKDGYMRISAEGAPLADFIGDNKTINEPPSILLADKIINDVMKLADKTKNKTSKKSDNKIPDALANIVFVEGEGLHRVEIALKDLNRITCPGKIGDPIYSKDKQIEIVRGGEKDLFVKISPVQTTYNGETKIVFNDFPREVFVECAGNVYNLSLIPKEITSQTMAIKTPIEDIFKAKSFEQGYFDFYSIISYNRFTLQRANDKS